MNNSEYIKIDIAKIAEGMLRRMWAIILTMVLFGGMLFSYATFMITPLYQAKALMYVNNSSFAVGATSFSITASELSAAQSLVGTYLVILKSRLTLGDVIERGELNLTYEQLYGMVSAEQVDETEVFSVTVTSPDPYEAEHIANTIAQVLPGKIAGVVEGSSVSIVDYAVVPSHKVSPSIKKYTIVGLLAGMLLSCGIIAVIEIMDDQIRSENYLLENYENIPLLTVIPDMLETNSKKGYYYYYRHDYRYADYKHEDENKDKKSDKRSAGK